MIQGDLHSVRYFTRTSSAIQRQVIHFCQASKLFIQFWPPPKTSPPTYVNNTIKLNHPPPLFPNVLPNLHQDGFVVHQSDVLSSGKSRSNFHLRRIFELILHVRLLLQHSRSQLRCIARWCCTPLTPFTSASHPAGLWGCYGSSMCEFAWVHHS